MKTVSLLWFRRELRLDDNPALQAALREGPVVPVYLHAPDEDAPWAPGAASTAWLRESLRRLDADLRRLGSGLVLRHGPSDVALGALARETGATAVHWNRLYEPAAAARDERVATSLRRDGLVVQTHNAALWVEPWDLANQSGAPYRVFTPFWRSLRARLEFLPEPDERPARLPLVALPAGETIDAVVPPSSPRWDVPMLSHWTPGEQGARDSLDEFVPALADYAAARDLPDRQGTSRLSPHLHFGEISPRRLLQRLRGAGDAAEPFLRQLGWREFSMHLLHHFPHSATQDLNPGFERFAWASDEGLLDAWRRGRTGVPLVDAGMRELWATGWMHNRVRMVAASFLTKHLRQHWLHGARWFWDTLVDADLANNSMGWQWVAGTGADASPYFRIFNPLTQAEKFDARGLYRRRWLPPGHRAEPIVDLKAGREAALAAYRASR